MQPISTRERLVLLLRVDGPLTAADLVKFLEVTPAAVHQHLERLRAEGWVEVTGLRRGRGRPRQVYALTASSDHLFPQQYDLLALDLLEAISSLPEGTGLLDRILAARREIWKERYGHLLSGKALDGRLAEITALFNAKGGLAEYAVLPDGSFLLTKRHCSISAVAGKYAQFCQEERAWLQEVLEAAVETRQCRAAGDAACVFRIVQPAQAVDDPRNHFTGKGEQNHEERFVS